MNQLVVLTANQAHQPEAGSRKQEAAVRWHESGVMLTFSVANFTRCLFHLVPRWTNVTHFQVPLSFLSGCLCFGCSSWWRCWLLWLHHLLHVGEDKQKDDVMSRLDAMQMNEGRQSHQCFFTALSPTPTHPPAHSGRLSGNAYVLIIISAVITSPPPC